jgi:uncharacterized protein YecE (DUF72 family)
MSPIWIGTSGFSYREWKPLFYPRDVPDKGFLAYYVTRLNAVEIDSTFYRIPSPKTIATWSGVAPESFRFGIKAPQRITHFERLATPSEANEVFLRVLEPLGPRLGMVLYQLPPNARADRTKLSRFLDALPTSLPCAFEFRHASWFTPEVFTILRERGVGLCIHDQDDDPPVLEITAPRTYVRLRRDQYDADARIHWQSVIQRWANSGTEVFAFVKHKDNPRAPLIALELAEGLAKSG